MREKTFELLKELLLLQSAGGGSSLDVAIEMAIEIYCEAAGLTLEQFTTVLDTVQKSIYPVGVTETINELQWKYNEALDTLGELF